MNRQELLRLAQWGARREVTRIERALNDLQRDFPDIFITTERVVLLKAELREEDSNGLSEAMRASWTPERRAAASRRAKKQRMWEKSAKIKKKGAKKRDYKAERERAARRKAAAAAKTTKKNGKPKWKDRWFDQLQAHGPEAVGASAKALKTNSGTLLSSAEQYLKDGIIEKTGPGVYKAVARP